MPSRKKLRLGPLPEQADNYSHYEESVIRWDRIIAVGALVLVSLLVIISLFFGADEERSDIQESASPSPHADKPVAESQVSIADKALINTESEAVSPLEGESTEAFQAKKPVERLKPIEATKSLEAKVLPAEEKPPATISDTQLSQPYQKEAPELNPASVRITNSAIKDVMLRLSTDKGLPAEPIQQSIIMPDSGLIKVMLHTEMHGLAGIRLYHEWSLDGKRQARVRVPVNTAKQTSYSSKFIDKHMLGLWQVKVLDDAGEAYVLADFEVIRGK